MRLWMGGIIFPGPRRLKRPCGTIPAQLTSPHSTPSAHVRRRPTHDRPLARVPPSHRCPRRVHPRHHARGDARRRARALAARRANRRGAGGEPPGARRVAPPPPPEPGARQSRGRDREVRRRAAALVRARAEDRCREDRRRRRDRGRTAGPGRSAAGRHGRAAGERGGGPAVRQQGDRDLGREDGRGHARVRPRHPRRDAARRRPGARLGEEGPARQGGPGVPARRGERAARRAAGGGRADAEGGCLRRPEGRRRLRPARLRPAAERHPRLPSRAAPRRRRQLRDPGPGPPDPRVEAVVGDRPDRGGQRDRDGAPDGRVAHARHHPRARGRDRRPVRRGRPQQHHPGPRAPRRHDPHVRRRDAGRHLRAGAADRRGRGRRAQGPACGSRSRRATR